MAKDPETQSEAGGPPLPGAPVLDAADIAGEGPLYQRIEAAIARKIASRAWAAGARIPHETALAEALGTSRMTVSRALAALQRQGLIERRRRRGTVVAERDDGSAPLVIQRIRDEAAARGGAYRFRVLSRAVEAAAGARTLVLTCLHWAGEAPLVLERRLISLSAVPEAEAEPFAEDAPGEWLLRNVGWSVAEHRIRAVAADAAAAEALHVPEGSPCLEIQRITWNGAREVTRVRLTYPGAAKELSGRFGPEDRDA